MDTLLRLAKLILGASCHHIVAVIDEVTDEILKIELTRATID